MNLNKFDQRYKDAVEQMAIKGSEKTFNNSGPIHASIVMTSIYRNAKDNITLYKRFTGRNWQIFGLYDLYE